MKIDTTLGEIYNFLGTNGTMGKTHWAEGKSSGFWIIPVI
jgi:hypothetical protein